MTDQPVWVCRDCGIKYGRRKWPDRWLTYHGGETCGVCGADTIVTEPRDFGYLRPEWKNHKRKE